MPWVEGFKIFAPTVVEQTRVPGRKRKAIIIGSNKLRRRAAAFEDRNRCFKPQRRQFYETKAVTVGSGWGRGRFGLVGTGFVKGDRMAELLEMEWSYAKVGEDLLGWTDNV